MNNQNCQEIEKKEGKEIKKFLLILRIACSLGVAFSSFCLCWLWQDSSQIAIIAWWIAALALVIFSLLTLEAFYLNVAKIAQSRAKNRAKKDQSY